jgi:3-(3-hydroxy-phenyl)propionate hydroxylase
MSKIFDTPLYAYQHHPDQDAPRPVRHKVVVIGAGPVGLALAIDLALKNVPVVVLDDNDRVSTGSRAICFAKRSLEYLDRLGCGDQVVEKGVVWDTGKVFFDAREIYDFALLAEEGHKRPAFVNLQQYHLEAILVERLRALQAEARPIDLRGGNTLAAIGTHADFVKLEIDTEDGPYNLECDWLVACDGVNSASRKMMGIDFIGREFEDNFLIADTIMEADFPSERWFWFDPPFNKGQSALLHKQPDNVWRIDFQIGWDIDREHELKEENIRARLHAMLGADAKFSLEWSSIYAFQCRQMEKFRHGRVMFAGDSAHQVSPFGAMGANSGLQDADNLAWKLRLVIAGDAPDALLDTYSDERVAAARQNLLKSTRSTDFITPKSEVSRVFRDAVLDLAEQFEFARPMVNSGRLSVPFDYVGSDLNGPDCPDLPAGCAPGTVAIDADVPSGWLLDQIGGVFGLMTIGLDEKARESVDMLGVKTWHFALDSSETLSARYLADAPVAVYLLRPDQHIAARWAGVDAPAILAAINIAKGQEASL